MPARQHGGVTVAVDPPDAPVGDTGLMRAALAAAESARMWTAPNPWVGAAVLTTSGEVAVGATRPPGGAHAEIEALAAAGDTSGATLATTLEPCGHHGRTAPCTDAIIEAGIRRVLVGVEDPDPAVAGSGVDQLRAAGIDVVVGVLADDVGEQLAPYLHHRRTGRPYVVAKIATTIDGRTAAPDLTSKWITGEPARTDTHRLRAESQAILVGAGTVRSDDPELTVRFVDGPDPMRVVLGSAPADAKVRPCLEWRGELGELLDHLGGEGVLQLMIEGGASTISQFHHDDLIDRYVFYVAPAIFGGDDARPLFVGDGAPTMSELGRGRFVRVERIGEDLRLDFVPVR